MLRAKVIHFNIQKKLFSKVGEPQGSVLSVLFFNLFMSRFDKFCLQLKVKKMALLSTIGSFSIPEKVNYKLYKFGAKQKVD